MDIQHIQYLTFYDPKDAYGWCSNFYTSKPITIQGETWTNTEQYFQAMKFRDGTPRGLEYSNIIKNADSPQKVKSLRTQKTHMYGGKWMINKKTDHRILNDVIKEYSDLKMRPDWEDVKVQVMIRALLGKFREKDLKEKLVSIPDNGLLVEHTTRDKIWADGGDGGTGEKGLNYLGKILTAIAHVLKYGSCDRMTAELGDAIRIGGKKKSPSPSGRKILSWNINGVRSNILGVGKHKTCGVPVDLDPESNLGAIIKEYDPDILCFQETRCNEAIAGCVKIKGYFQYWNYSQGSGARSGDRYSGVSIWSKVEPKSISYSLPNLDDKEGRILLADFGDFLLLNTYVPNAGTNFEYRVKVWDPAILDFLRATRETGQNLIWAGDLNVARTPLDVFWGDPKSSSYDKKALEGVGKYAKAGYTKEEREDMEAFLAEGYTDVYRKLYPDDKDAYTFWSARIPMLRLSNKGWRIDYFVVSRSMETRVKDMEILRDAGMRTKPFASDHAPILLFLK